MACITTFFLIGIIVCFINKAQVNYVFEVSNDLFYCFELINFKI